MGRRATRPGKYRAERTSVWGKLVSGGALIVSLGLAVGMGWQLLPADTVGQASFQATAITSTPVANWGQPPQIEVAPDAAIRDRERRQADARARRVARKAAARLQAEQEALPANSGDGYRVVYHRANQRVWLVDHDNKVLQTHLVSGSIYNNLQAGNYAVYSRSRYANAINNGGQMEYFVRFARGPNAAIGFHNIPTKNGVPLQTPDQLGTPLSSGCVRQLEKDAIALWNFAPVGTPVVVL